VVKYYSFLVLPFGLTSAPYIFTKCLRPLVKHWRSKGMCIVVYLDDGWGREASEEKCAIIANSVKADLISAGLVPNKEKSVWVPVNKLDWLGLSWDSVEGSMAVSTRRVADLLNSIEYVRASEVAQSYGQEVGKCNW
jgi:hypothetical protein